MNYYEILGISKSSDRDTIKKAYRNLAIKWHPDKNLDNIEEATKKFKEISEAYQILSDNEKKEKYDKYGETPTRFESPEELFRQIFSNLDPIVSNFLTSTFSKITQSFIDEKNKNVWDIVNGIDREEIIEGGSNVVKQLLMKNLAKKNSIDKSYSLKLDIDDIDYENEINIDIKFAKNYNYINLELNQKGVAKNYRIDTDYIEHIITFGDQKYTFLLIDQFPPGYERFRSHDLILRYSLHIKYKKSGFRLYYPYFDNDHIDCNISFNLDSNIVKIPEKGLLKHKNKKYGDLYIIFNFEENDTGVHEEPHSTGLETFNSIDPLVLIHGL